MGEWMSGIYDSMDMEILCIFLIICVVKIEIEGRRKRR